jgi:hypothetical protein
MTIIKARRRACSTRQAPFPSHGSRTANINLSRPVDRPAYPYTHIRVVPGRDQSRHVRALSYKMPTWVSELRHHRLLLSWQRAGGKLVLDQQFP